jgi:hypothetical protein
MLDCDTAVWNRDNGAGNTNCRPTAHTTACCRGRWRREQYSCSRINSSAAGPQAGRHRDAIGRPGAITWTVVDWRPCCPYAIGRTYPNAGRSNPVQRVYRVEVTVVVEGIHAPVARPSPCFAPALRSGQGRRAIQFPRVVGSHQTRTRIVHCLDRSARSPRQRR